MKNVLALVVARGGSKGIPGKNLHPVAGRPLIEYTFDAAKNSRMLSRTILSTDSPEIAEAARRCSIEVPFLRPAELAADDSPVLDAAQHALSWLEPRESYLPDYVLLLQATSPLRTAKDIDAAIAMAFEGDLDAVVSVSAAEQHPLLMKRLDENGCLAPFIESPLSQSRRQALPQAFAVNGAIYLVRRTVLLEMESWCPPGAGAYLMPAERSLDIDTPWDMRIAETILRGGS